MNSALTAWRADYDFYNFAVTPVEAEVTLPSASYERLQRIRASNRPGWPEAVVHAT
ncbi:MAG: hypothetical protein ACLP0J_13315 [Solirubrobacteraceae bacterium]